MRRRSHGLEGVAASTLARVRGSLVVVERGVVGEITGSINRNVQYSTTQK